MLLVFTNTTAIASIKSVRFALSFIGGIAMPASALALKEKSKLYEEKSLMRHEVALDVENALLQAHVKQFNPEEILNPAPAMVLPQGSDEASTLASTIIRTLATANPKRPLILNH
ncbi:MAG: hypothetical protein ACRC8Y_16375, partial [Chroococcales cyanobacterium]